MTPADLNTPDIAPYITSHRVATKFRRQNSRIFQGCFKGRSMIFKDVKMLRRCRVVVLIWGISVRCITLRAEFKDFKDGFQNSRTFKGSTKILTKIQGPFKEFKDFFKDVATLSQQLTTIYNQSVNTTAAYKGLQGFTAWIYLAIPNIKYMCVSVVWRCAGQMGSCYISIQLTVVTYN